MLPLPSLQKVLSCHTTSSLDHTSKPLSSLPLAKPLLRALKFPLDTLRRLLAPRFDLAPEANWLRVEPIRERPTIGQDRLPALRLCRGDVERPQDPRDGDEQGVARKVHAHAYPPAKPEWKLEVLETRIGRLEEALWNELIWGWEHDGVVHYASVRSSVP